MTKLKVLLFTKQTAWCDKVIEFCWRNFDTVHNDLEHDKKVDYVISYLSPWILPKKILDLAKIAAINFHPGPPKYPGIGGYNFALYNGDTMYGVVCHEMEEKVDSGKILDSIFFPVRPNSTVETLKEESMAHLLHLFYKVMDGVMEGTLQYHYSGRQWEREPYTRKDLQNLCKWTTIVEEFGKWYNACYFPEAIDKPHIKFEGKKYYVIREDHYGESVSGWQLPSRYYNTT